jgi:hypothetical protein
LERQAELLCGGFEMTALARQVVPGIVMAGIGDLRTDQRIGLDDQLAPVANGPAPIVVR